MPHLGGIEGHPGSAGVQTLGRSELLTFLKLTIIHRKLFGNSVLSMKSKYGLN